MFDPWCPTCASRVLLTTRRLLRLAPTPDGHRAHLRCWCGTVVVMDVARVGPDRGEVPPVPGASPRVA